MSEKLDLETFNRTLMGEMKKESHLKFLKLDLEAAMASMIQEMINLVDALNNNMPYHDILEKNKRHGQKLYLSGTENKRTGRV